MIEVESHKVPRGMTRQTILSGWNFPLLWLLPVLGIPIVIAFVNKNIFWLGLIGPATILARRLADDRDNSPRLSYLALISGSTFCKRERGVEVVHPLSGTGHNGLGLLHD